VALGLELNLYLLIYNEVLFMTKIDLSSMLTEQQNPATQNIDELSSLEIVRLMNGEDKKAVLAVEKILPEISAAADKIAERLKAGGRLFYVGAGTSGRLGILDAVECPPTFSVPPEMVQGVIAGGNAAIFKAKEGAEDNFALGESDMKSRNLTAKDVVVGIAASGRTPYVLGALNYAAKLGAPTVAITCNPCAPLLRAADYPLLAVTGPEVITGSTRLKAGTAQKLILNMLSTTAMIKLGKVYGNLMVDVNPSNEKLNERACHIIMEATGCEYEKSQEMLAMAGGVKLAIFMLLTGLTKNAAEKRLAAFGGHIAKALKGEEAHHE
jgi:N-acetylmuramic acid 6-phosphate etherase